MSKKEKPPGKMHRIWDKIKPSKKHTKKSSDASTKHTKKSSDVSTKTSDKIYVAADTQTQTEDDISYSKSAVEIALSPTPTPQAGIAKSADQIRTPERRIPEVTIYEPVVTKIQPAKSSFKKKKKSSKKKTDKPPQGATNAQTTAMSESLADVWEEYSAGHRFPQASSLVMAMGQPFKSLPDESTTQYVACRYLHGDPVMGRVWNDGGKISASFTAGGREIRGTKIPNKILLLQAADDFLSGFTYEWKPFTEVISFDSSKRVWQPVLVGHVTPGVIPVGDVKILGQVDIKNEIASYGYNGEQKSLTGPEARKTTLLCRKNR